MLDRDLVGDWTALRIKSEYIFSNNINANGVSDADMVEF